MIVSNNEVYFKSTIMSTIGISEAKLPRNPSCVSKQQGRNGKNELIRVN